MATIPPFLIEGLEGVSHNGEKATGNIITGFISSDYGTLIKAHPEARLKYLDEDGDEVIVGSSTELIDRLNELPSTPLSYYTTAPGLSIWLDFLHSRSALSSEQIKTTEEIEKTLLEGFQRDLERAIKESLESQTNESSSSTDNTSRPQPKNVDSFLNTLTSTVQSTLSSVYPHTAQITTALRQNPALRQAAEIIQTVGRTAHNTIQHPEEKIKTAADVAGEIKGAVRTVGNVLGDVAQEVGSAYAMAGREIAKDVKKVSGDIGREVGKVEVKKTVATVGSTLGGVMKDMGQAYAIVGREIGKGVMGAAGKVKNAAVAAAGPVGAGGVAREQDKTSQVVEMTVEDMEEVEKQSTSEDKSQAAEDQPTTEGKTDESTSQDKPKSVDLSIDPTTEASTLLQKSAPAVTPKPIEALPETINAEEAFENTAKSIFDKLLSASDADLDAMLAAADGKISQEITKTGDDLDHASLTHSKLSPESKVETSTGSNASGNAADGKDMTV